MKYKLLSEKGVHFVCLEDGTKIPRQERTTVTQECRDVAIATVEAHGFSNAKDTLWMDGDRLRFGDVVLEGLISLFMIKKEVMNSHFDKRLYKFSMVVELPDTAEKPKQVA